MSVTLRHRPPLAAIARTELATGLRIQRNAVLVVLGLGALLAVLMMVALAQVPIPAEGFAEGDTRHSFELSPPIGLLVFLAVLWPLIVWRPDPVNTRGYMWAQAADRRVSTAFRVLAGWLGLLGLIAAIAVGAVAMGAIMQPLAAERANANVSVTAIPHAAAIIGPTIIYLLATCFGVLFRRPGLVMLGVVLGSYVAAGIIAGLVMSGFTAFERIVVFATAGLQSLALAATGAGMQGATFLGVSLASDNWPVVAAGWLALAAAAAAASVWIFRETAR